MLQSVGLSLIYLASSAAAKCYEPSPAFPVPAWKHGATALQPAFGKIHAQLHELIDQSRYDNSSFSVEITSSSETLWGAYHTARHQNKTRPGDTSVDSSSRYRIASITKVFTTLALLYQHNAGNLSLGDPVSEYIEELNSPDYELPWKDISLRILASQLSGLPRDWAQGDWSNSPLDPSDVGLPPASTAGLPRCDEYNDYVPCNRTQLLDRLKDYQPLFAPNQKSTYSNINFELLGLVLSNVTGVPYEDYISQAIFDQVHLTESSFATPSDEHAVLPLLPNGNNYWGIDEGVQNPTGGIYSSAGDLSKFLRYILTHYNTLTTGVNWLLPASQATGINTFYGMPWEIFTTDRILEHSHRPVTFVTKAGGLPGYSSRISILADYGLGATILVGGNSALLAELQEVVTVELVRAAEEVIWQEMQEIYTGHFIATEKSLNSSLSLAASPSKGLHLSSFISNGTDVLATLFPYFVDKELSGESKGWHAQLLPTLLYEDEKKQAGEIFRVLVVMERDGMSENRPIWDDFCITDVDQVSYAGQPLNKLVYWHERREIELPAFNVTLKAVAEEKLVVQTQK